MKLVITMTCLLACSKHDETKPAAVAPPRTSDPRDPWDRRPSSVTVTPIAQTADVDVAPSAPNPTCLDDDHLSVAGKKRDAWAMKLVDELAGSDQVANWDNGVMVVADGCDASTLAISLGGHSGGRCDANSLKGLLRDLRGTLRQLGFIKLMCQPDGPELDVR